ncbi:putative F box protein [Candida maltosa Xu316]|uniref:Putative F box protein n=1 Tax=Candida maltosa (strain Xu316) TaxID=1245528 RepID=M3J5C6_CANMX|nr:putative F box protein [Candida maltosa Xu316]
MLLQLPQEILELLVYKLHQDELVHLSQTCRYLKTIIQPRLFHSISIDSSPKFFLETTSALTDFQESFNLVQIDDKLIRQVNISSIYNLKLFFRKMIDDKELAGFIKSFNVEKLPDIPDLEILDYLGMCLPLMTNLQRFNWNHDSCPISMDMLKNNLKVMSVNGNITNTTNRNLKEGVVTSRIHISSQFEKLTLKNIDLKGYCCQFPSLKSLAIENCTNEIDFLNSLDSPYLDNLSLSITSDGFEERDAKISNYHIFNNLKSIKLSINTLDQCFNQSLLENILTNLNHNTLLRLEINSQRFTNFNNVKQFKHLKYLKVSILQNDIYRLLSNLNQSITVISLDIVEKMNERRNCFLISPEYWNYSTKLRDENLLTFTDFTLEYNRKLHNLKWIRYNTTTINNDSSSFKIVLKSHQNKSIS